MSGLSRELLAEIRRIEIHTRRLANQQMAGHYQSVFKGRGMTFDEVRQYIPGDDPRFIDWNVTARTGAPHIKVYTEERELTVQILIDLSGSMAFGALGSEKRRLAAKLAAVMAFSAIGNGDRVGLVSFSDQIERHVPPAKGRTHVLRLLDEILRFDPVGRGTDLEAALNFVGRVNKRRAVVLLISDFLSDPKRYERALKVAARRHDLIPLVLSDPRELELPASLGLIRLEGLEGEGVQHFDLSGRGAARYAAAQRAARAQRADQFRRAGLTPVEVLTDSRDYAKPLVNYFQLRARRG